jgi:6-phosphogluconolactonase (cycloisomerase 2 family)
MENHTMRFFLIFITGALLLSEASAQELQTYIYVESNVGSVPNQNSIYAFANDGLGNLIGLSGSPYLTGGTGVQASGSQELNGDQEVIANRAGSALYAVNGHTNSIAAFRVNANGTLTAIAGSPYASGGQDPVSLGLAGKFLVVANKNIDPKQNRNADVPNYTTFSVKQNGSLTMNPGSTLDLLANSGPSQALVSGRNRLVFGLELFTSRIASFRYDRSGLLSEVSSIDPTTTGGAFLGEILHPNQPILYAGLLSTSELGVYSFDSAGAISFVNAISNDGINICWLRMNAAGTRLYSSESVTNTLTVYDTTDALNPVQIQHLPLNAPDGFVINIELDPTEKFLYALAGHGIHTLNVDAGGMLSETVDPLVLSTPDQDSPIGLAVIRK